jgi:hypothetical protein
VGKALALPDLFDQVYEPIAKLTGAGIIHPVGVAIEWRRMTIASENW